MHTSILNVYYRFLKPIIPRKLQISLRRLIAKRKKTRVGGIWPIDERAGKKPEKWKGWHDSKKFAFVLTHDVERAGGLEKCLSLMEIEKEYGFRSSFNFVPEDYTVTPELREKLKDEGFEVGVHGLNHKGNIFGDRVLFDRQAAQINKYLKEWGAVGFRAPSMFHNLEWIKNLDIEYDSSTFDTDPFEPQPDGVGTIFPFSVNGNHIRPGYVELPYTLPQDFLLFIILRQKNIDIWKRKLDWIAKQGGMALFSVHPDYIYFKGARSSFEEYPMDYYKEILGYVKSIYEGQYWHALPSDIAKFYREFVSQNVQQRNIII